MHNRDLIWTTSDDREFKIKEMTSSHITNTRNHILKNMNSYINLYGKESYNLYLKTFDQEIRYRKIKRIEIDNNDELF